ncbi:MAG TPA: hypothetical protein V6D19_17660 [Stenomitos sp.]
MSYYLGRCAVELWVEVSKEFFARGDDQRTVSSLVEGAAQRLDDKPIEILTQQDFRAFSEGSSEKLYTQAIDSVLTR